VSFIDKGLETNNDGTVTLYMGPEAPKGKEGNWIPTAKGQQYYMLFRFYGAEDPVFTKTWQLSDGQDYGELYPARRRKLRIRTTVRLVGYRASPRLYRCFLLVN
jgi:hypothetical protein